MGAEAACTVTIGRKKHAGKALLESSDLLFRGGDVRLKVPFKDMTSVEAKAGKLRVSYSGTTADFDLGEQLAATWAEKIEHPPSLLDKLGVKPDHRVVVLGVKNAAFLSDLKRHAPDVSRRVRREADVIVFGAEAIEHLARLRELRQCIRPNGMIWTITPKGKGGIKDTDVMAAGRAAGLVDVKVASFSATHSAAKFVIPKAQR